MALKENERRVMEIQRPRTPRKQSVQKVIIWIHYFELYENSKTNINQEEFETILFVFKVHVSSSQIQDFRGGNRGAAQWHITEAVAYARGKAKKKRRKECNQEVN